MEDQSLIDWDYGDLDIRLGVSEGMDEEQPKSAEDDECTILDRSFAEDQHYLVASREIGQIEYHADLYGAMVVENPAEAFDLLGGEEGCRKTMGDAATEWLMAKVIDYEDSRRV